MHDVTDDPANYRLDDRARETMNEPHVGPLEELITEVRAVNRGNGWDITEATDFNSNPEKVLSKLCLVHSEASEAAEAVRVGDLDNFVEELADVVIRVFDTVGAFTSDFDCVIRAKIEKNRSRGYRHGGKRV